MNAVVTPDWVKDAVFYQIFPDTFARSKRVPKPARSLCPALPPRAPAADREAFRAVPSGSPARRLGVAFCGEFEAVVVDDEPGSQ